MYLRKLTLTNVRALRKAEFDFLGKPGVHLIVGVNGVGKSTALDVLRVLLSNIIPQFIRTGVQADSFKKDKTYITTGEKSLIATVTGEIMDYPFSFLIEKEDMPNSEDNRPIKERNKREQTVLRLPSKDPRIIALKEATKKVVRNVRAPETQELIAEASSRIANSRQGLLAIYYSPHRSLITRESAKIGRTQLEAYVEALDDERRFSIKSFTEWWRIQQWRIEQQTESVMPSPYEELNAVFEQVVSTFLDKCNGLRLTDDNQLVITKNAIELNVDQLSDGERNALTLGLDLARRLYLANPELSNPVQQGQAIVLIDELDLHLHPGWQRDVVRKLEKTFPKCQFIASTHSPQIIGEVSHKRISVIRSEGIQVVKPSQSYGMDANWVIDVLMGAKSRNKGVTARIQRMNNMIADGKLPSAKKILLKLRKDIGFGSPEISRAEAMIKRLERVGNEKN